MEIVLTAELEKLVESKVESGLYPRPEDVLRAALQLLEERDRLYQARLSDLRVEINKGLSSGTPVPAERVLAALHAKGKARNIPAK